MKILCKNSCVFENKHFSFSFFMCRNTSFGHYFRCKESVDNNPQFHEIEFIYEISKNLGYERYFVDKAHYKANLLITKHVIRKK